MKKHVSVLLALCLVCGTLGFTLPAQVAAAGQTSYDLTLTYTDASVNNGIVDRNDTATTATVTKDGMSALQVTPNPESSKPTTPVSLDHYSYRSRELSLETLKSISFYCYYTGNASLDKAQLRVLKGTPESMTTNLVEVSSRANIKKNRWAWIEFDLSTALQGKTVDGAVLTQFHFRPYGTSGTPSKLTSGDVVYIAKIRLTTNESAGSGDYLLSFRPGRPDVTGDAPMADTYVNIGDTITLPPNTYSREGYTFSSYVTSINQFFYYQPGDTFTVPDIPTGAGMAGTAEHLYFIPTFTRNAEAFEGCEPVRTVDYSDWFSSVDSLKKNGVSYARVTKDYIFDGQKTLMVEPITDCTSPRSLALDSYNWTALPWNVDYYKYVTVQYYLETDDNILSSYRPQLRLIKNGDALSSSQTITAKETIEANRWAILNFDLSQVTTNPAVSFGHHVLKQLHFLWQSDAALVTSFSPGTKLYIGKIALLHETPAKKPELVLNYMNGDPGGIFRPHDKVTKAESAQLLYNLLRANSLCALPEGCVSPYSDVSDPSLWYYTSVATLATLGILPNTSTFSPAQPVTRQEFAVYVQNALYRLNAVSISGSALFGSGDTLTREEVASILNRLIFGEIGRTISDDFLDSARMTRFSDVTPQIWSYSDIVAATAPRLSYYENGTEHLLALLADTVSPVNDPEKCDTSAGDAKILEVDALTDSRISEIRATANTVDPANWTTGTVYYLSSSSGSTFSAGTSATSPRRISDLSAVSTKVGNATIKAGDVLLFKRGDTFRGQLTCVAGVTYSAYGTGAKPLIIRNTETAAATSSRWTLDYENAATGAKIWKYSNTSLNDVGAIMLINGSDITVAYKEIPDYIGGQWYVRGSAQTIPFDYKTQLDRDLEFVQFDPPSESSGAGNGGPSTGPFYLRCDAGNPGTLYSQIEFCLAKNCIQVGTANNVTIDNLCIKYFGAHAVGAGSVRNLKVTNCEIGWGGGAIQNFTSGKVTRYGNGIQIYGGCENYTIDNCYVYQIYDAGITHQISGTSGGNYYMGNVQYTNNVLEYSVYNIEYFLTKDNASDTTERFMEDIVFDGNIIRKAGYGWGVQRPDHAPSNIKGWDNSNNKAIGFTITNNIIDRTYNGAYPAGMNDWLCQLGTGFVGCEPYMEGNTFIQVPGRLFVQAATTAFLYNADLPTKVAPRIGAANNEFYFCSEGAEEISINPIYHGVIR